MILHDRRQLRCFDATTAILESRLKQTGNAQEPAQLMRPMDLGSGDPPTPARPKLYT
ncbi:hypothetical protein NOVOSPHI9U_590014 [Novosphingobium sp. 9U]|nr:hypothetical protein NOVOSPHI9U_590014 [Novosphingobium sp. 9U]